MTQPPHEGPSGHAMPVNPETARIVLRLDDAISAFRAGEPTGLHALDSASRLIGELTDDANTSAAALRGERLRVPQRPDRVELAILTALADTYGSEILTNASLGYTLRLVARHGGVALGGFNWSLQHLLKEVPNGTSTGLGFGTDRKTDNAIARQARCQSARDEASVLELRRARHGERGCGARVWRVTTFGAKMVS
jgi:hypothetical protein